MARQYGAGSVYEDKARGCFVAQVMVDGHRRRVYAPTKALARAKAAELVYQKDRGGVVAAGGTTAQWLNDWLDDVLPGTVAASTEAQYRQVVKDWVAPYVGRMPLAKLGPEHVLRMMRQLEAKGLSPTTVATARKVLRRALRQAEQYGKVARNVAAIVDPPKGAGRPKTDDTMTADEADRVLAAAAGDRLEALAWVVLFLGLRQAEALGLRWEDVDFAHGVLEVAGTKTKGSNRALPLPAKVAEAWRGHPARQRQERMAAPLWADADLVFTSTVGTVVDRWRASDWWHKLCERAGVGHRRFHSSRHTAATLMLNNGVPLEVVSKILGHSGLSTTADVYARPGAAMLQKAADAMDRLLGGAK